MRTRYMGVNHMPVARVEKIALKDPKNFRQAMKDPRANKWKQAIRDEIEALEQSDTWEVIKRPRNAKLLHTKWVFKLKTHTDGSIEPFKARLVARSDQQEYGVDYTYTFSAVLDMMLGKMILVVSRIWKVPARHGDVLRAYVKADKEAELGIMLNIPEGMVISDALLMLLGVTDKREIALLLKKGFCYTDSCMYAKIEVDGTTLVGVYVDDLLVTGTSEATVDKFVADMQVVELKDLGVVSKFLGTTLNYVTCQVGSSSKSK
ncbi:hypothetical protein PF002_g7398 [Phytophthora fragariae]|uniref:Reverse transcriptase Ty1/copia-type domain-containing protein n=2 Tax=Phytophthora fragariae TaxID=53985 RepID=A0A6A4A0F8_9STRA|nr:hypothetical protein PF002_g7398 [Phytophthora fragariae]